MTTQYKKISTSYEVWATIKRNHSEELRVFSSYSAPNGDQFGDLSTAVMYTEYGFLDADCPLIGAETKWDVDSSHSVERKNERHKYWLCAPMFGLPNDD